MHAFSKCGILSTSLMCFILKHNSWKVFWNILATEWFQTNPPHPPCYGPPGKAPTQQTFASPVSLSSVKDVNLSCPPLPSRPEASFTAPPRLVFISLMSSAPRSQCQPTVTPFLSKLPLPRNAICISHQIDSGRNGASSSLSRWKTEIKSLGFGEVASKQIDFVWLNATSLHL